MKTWKSSFCSNLVILFVIDKQWPSSRSCLRTMPSVTPIPTWPSPIGQLATTRGHPIQTLWPFRSVTVDLNLSILNRPLFCSVFTSSVIFELKWFWFWLSNNSLFCFWFWTNFQMVFVGISLIFTKSIIQYKCYIDIRYEIAQKVLHFAKLRSNY